MKVILVMFLLFTDSSHAQYYGGVRGKVVDSTIDELVPFALIKLYNSDTLFRVKSDLDGKFAFNAIPAGEYQIDAKSYEDTSEVFLLSINPDCITFSPDLLIKPDIIPFEPYYPPLWMWNFHDPIQSIERDWTDIYWK